MTGTVGKCRGLRLDVSLVCRVNASTPPSDCAKLLSVKTADLVTIDLDILGGKPVFKGTRVPVEALFDYLEDNYSLEEFLECFPSVFREAFCALLVRSKDAVLAMA